MRDGRRRSSGAGLLPREPTSGRTPPTSDARPASSRRRTRWRGAAARRTSRRARSARATSRSSSCRRPSPRRRRTSASRCASSRRSRWAPSSCGARARTRTPRAYRRRSAPRWPETAAFTSTRTSTRPLCSASGARGGNQRCLQGGRSTSPPRRDRDALRGTGRKIHVPAAAPPRRPPRNRSEDPRPRRGETATPSAELVGSGRRVRRARAGRRRALGVAAVEQPRLRPRRADVHVVSRPPRGVRRARGGHRRDGREFGPRRAAGGLRL